MALYRFPLKLTFLWQVGRSVGFANTPKPMDTGPEALFVIAIVVKRFIPF